MESADDVLSAVSLPSHVRLMSDVHGGLPHVALLTVTMWLDGAGEGCVFCVCVCTCVWCVEGK